MSWLCIAGLLITGCTAIQVTPTNSATQVVQTARALVTFYGTQTAAANKIIPPQITPNPPVPSPVSPASQAPTPTFTKQVVTASTGAPIRGVTLTNQPGAKASPTALKTISPLNFKDAKVYIGFLSETRSQISIVLPNETLKKTSGFIASSGGQSYACGDLVSVTNTIRIICTGPRLKSGTVAKVSLFVIGATTPIFEGAASVP